MNVMKLSILPNVIAFINIIYFELQFYEYSNFLDFNIADIFNDFGHGSSNNSEATGKNRF